MEESEHPLSLALRLVWSADPELVEIIRLSLFVSGSSVALGSLLALPLGGLLGVSRFPGRGVVVAVLTSLMSLPPVVVGLCVYLLLSRSGPLGTLGILFTPQAMIVAQVILIVPIVASFTAQTVMDLEAEYSEQLRSLGVGRMRRVATLLWDGRFSLWVALLAGFGRAISEVGAVLIVGGNIAHLTRVMTTAIALETSRGDLALALALGVVLLGIALLVNLVASLGRATSQRMAGVVA